MLQNEVLRDPADLDTQLLLADLEGEKGKQLGAVAGWGPYRDYPVLFQKHFLELFGCRLNCTFFRFGEVLKFLSVYDGGHVP